MTNLEAIEADLRPFPVEESLIKRKCAKYGLNPDESLTQDEKTINTIVVEILSQMISMNNVGEGGVSLSFSKSSVETNIIRLCKESGLDCSKYVKIPTVTRLE